MLTSVIVGVVAAIAGFGVGRIKNASKLKAISGELAKVKTGVVADVDSLVAKIKAKL